MKELEERIQSEGVVIGGDIVKVDSFINHQIDIVLLNDICSYLAHPFHNIDKVLTIETSGIAFAIGTAQQLGNVPMVFAKKSKSKIVDETNLFLASVKSFTRGTVSTIGVDKRFLKKGERILIVDDFLAEGSAALGLIDLCAQAGATVVGVAVVIEKSFQGGRDRIERLGLPIVCAANIQSIANGKIVFGKD
jgi:xanthine phosphoribosyltransferase